MLVSTPIGRLDPIAYFEYCSDRCAEQGDYPYWQHYQNLLYKARNGIRLTDVIFDDESAEGACTSAACVAKVEAMEAKGVV